MNGYVVLILTAHVPYLRAAGRQPVGEDILHETIAYSLVPTINALFDLRDQGLRPRVALAYSPLLLDQLADNVVQKHFIIWMEDWLSRVGDELRRRERAGDDHYAYLTRFYLDWGQGILRSFVERYGRNLTAALRELCDDGLIEPLFSPATHAYLPLLERAESVRAQLEVGLLATIRLLGIRPRGLWLPECGYHPNLGQHSIAVGARYVVVDTSSVAGDSYVTHLRPRWVAPRRLAALIRDPEASTQVWSPTLGYLGDPLYLAQRRDEQSGLACWRNGLAQEAGMYDPYHAFRRSQEHAAHFGAFVAAELAAFRQRHDRPGIVVVPLDAELLGRRWFEGPMWLRAIIEELGGHPNVALTTPSAYLRVYRPRQGMTLREGSWGAGGDHQDWSGYQARPLWQALYEAEERVALLVRRFPHARGIRERVLAQAVRELMLAQSSDWPLLISRGSTMQDVLDRPLQHLHRCERLCVLAEQDDPSEADLALLDQLEEFDNPFPHLNYRIFTA